MKNRVSSKQPKQGILKASNKTSFSKLVLVFLGVGLGVVFLTGFILYGYELDKRGSQLKTLAQTHTTLLHSIVESSEEHKDSLLDGSARVATLDKLFEAHLEENGFGETGEFILGEKKGDKIHFLIPSRILGRKIPPVDLASEVAGPMRLALRGRSGFINDLDYRNEVVFGWYEPVPELNVGLVIKMDISEIRHPYIVAIAIGSLTALVMSFLAAVVFSQIEARRLSRANNTGHEGLDSRGRILLYLALVGFLMAVGGVSATSVSGFVYSNELKIQKSELLSSVKSLASLMRVFSPLDQQINTINSAMMDEVVIPKLQYAMNYNQGFGRTGEYVLGVVSGSKIKFLLPARTSGILPSSVNISSDIAEPMRRALDGQAGVIEALDYNGNRVVAAFHPIRQMNVGLVAKIDIEELWQPYIMIGVISVSLTIFLVAFGILLTPRFIESMKVRREDHGFSSDLSNEAQTLTLTARQNFYILALIAGLSWFLFYLDSLTPLGVAVGIPYIGLIIMGSFVTDKRGMLLLACFATALIFGGIAIAPNEGVTSWKVAINRIYPVLTIWLAVIILLRIKSTDHSLRQSKQGLVVVLESFPDATLIVQQDGQIVFANQQAEALFEYSKSRLIGMQVEDLVPEETRGNHVDLRTSFQNNPTTRPMGLEPRLYASKGSGEKVPVEISLAPVKTSAGQVVVANIRDITESVHREQEINRHAKELKRSNEELQTFAYAASHDLQEPLRKIQAFSERLSVACADTLDERGRGYVERMVESASRMRTLIDDLLAFSRVTSHAQPYKKINLSVIVREMLGDLETTINEAGAKIHVSDLPIINTDKTQMRQVMQNLVSNAIKFKQNDTPPTIKINAETTDEFTRITVSDNGIGFDPKYAEQIFGLFDRLHGRSEYAGTGIGLATCKKIVERHGGKIVAEGRPGEGSTFTITLPTEPIEGIL